MYEFIRLQYIMGRLTAFDVLGMSPKFITIEQAEKIIGKDGSSE